MAWALWWSFVADVDTMPMQASDTPAGWDGSSLLFRVAFVSVVLVGRWRQRLLALAISEASCAWRGEAVAAS